jgi:phosphoribosylglycinamide formyltransferase-1
MNVAVLISGRGSNLHAILEAEKKNQLGDAKVKLIVSNNPEAEGLKYSKQYDIRSLILDRNKFRANKNFELKLIQTLQEHNIDLIVLAGFMQILTEEFIDLYYGKVINIHPSLLPSFPGLTAQSQALEHGVKVSGCTVHFVNAEVDSGPIILQETVKVSDSDTETTLSDKILKIEHKLLPLAISLISTNKVTIVGRIVRIDE